MKSYPLLSYCQCRYNRERDYSSVVVSETAAAAEEIRPNPFGR